METKRHRTLLCVGSGLARRYKQNTLQILALPRGAHIQFRYDESIIQYGLRKPLRLDQLRGASVLLGYVDCTSTGRRSDGYCPVIPCRYGKILHSSVIGSVFILQFELLDFAATTTLEALQTSLPPGRPHWGKDGAAQRPIGEWCLELPAEFQACARSDDPKDWQRIVEELSKYQDFSAQPYYFKFVGLFEKDATDPVCLKDGAYTLHSDRYYELRILHWDPSADPHSGHKDILSIKVRVTESWFKVRTNSILTIDSPYDVDAVLMKTGSATRTEEGLLELVEQQENPSLNRLPVELYLSIKLQGSFWKTVLYGFFIGALLWAQQYVTSPPANRAAPVQLAAFAIASITGFFIAFAIPKPT